MILAVGRLMLKNLLHSQHRLIGKAVEAIVLMELIRKEQENPSEAKLFEMAI